MAAEGLQFPCDLVEFLAQRRGGDVISTAFFGRLRKRAAQVVGGGGEGGRPQELCRPFQGLREGRGVFRIPVAREPLDPSARVVDKPLQKFVHIAPSVDQPPPRPTPASTRMISQGA